MTGDRGIDYEALTQQAMRNVVRTVLGRVARAGLPGEHHFYIAFDTQYPGVSLSRRLKEKYPEEMTIVMQHRFWDLAVSDDYFEVKLTFDGIPERLVIPFDAVRVFFDPSVRFSAQFDDPASFEQALDSEPASRRKPRSRTPRRPTAVTQQPLDTSADAPMRDVEPTELGPTEQDREPIELEPARLRRPARISEADKPSDEPAPDTESPDSPAAAPGAQIFSLDAFRKK
ncbi:MAG: hypothetical protein RLZ98_901 [Pseudomonadota bacterium]|jgi:hypothetical protein